MTPLPYKSETDGDPMALSEPPPHRALPAPALVAGWRGTETQADSLLTQQWRILRQHLGKIALFVIATVMVTGFYLLRLPSLYDSMAVIRVDPSAPTSLVSQNPNQPVADVSTLMATEAAEIRNPAVVIPVILAQHLETDPAFDYKAPKKGPDARIGGVPESLLRAVLDDMTVVRPADTYLLDVTFRSPSPQLSARVANALAAELISHEHATRSQALRSSSQYLSSQVDELRAQMESSQASLTTFETANNIVGDNDKFNLMNQRLSAIATDLDKQQEQERHLEGELALAQKGDLDAILVSGRGDALKPLMDALHTQQLNFATVSSKYGPGAYVYREAQRQLQDVQNIVNTAVSHIVDQIQAEAYAQQVQTAATAKRYNQQIADVEDFNSKSAKYNELKQQAASQSKLYEDLLQRIEDADVTAGYHSDNLRIVGEAEPSAQRSYPRIRISLIIAFIVSLLLAVTAVMTLRNFDRTMTDPSGVAAGTGELFLGSLPKTPNSALLHSLWQSNGGAGAEPGALAKRHSAYGEAILSLRTTLFLGSSTPLTALALTSAQPREGKTTTSISLAVASALNSQRTVLVDADLRRPSVHRELQLPNRIGFSSHLLGLETLDDIIVTGPISHLSIIPAGPAVGNSTELLTKGFGPFLEDLKSRFECIVVDCPPILGFADSMIIGPTVDAVLLVARAGVTQHDYVRAAAEQLHRVRATIAGIVLNGVSSRMSPYYSYYRDYSRYYKAEDRD